MMAVPSYIPSDSVERLQFLHLLTNILSLFFFFWIIHIVTEERHYFMVFLMGISLILVMLGTFHSSRDRVCL